MFFPLRVGLRLWCFVGNEFGGGAFFVGCWYGWMDGCMLKPNLIKGMDGNVTLVFVIMWDFFSFLFFFLFGKQERLKDGVLFSG